MTNASRQERLIKALSEKILILDGAMGTRIQKLNLSSSDFGGILLEGCNEILNITRPDVISSIHLSYLEAGADIIETNSFGATPVVLKEYGISEDKTIEINERSAKIAREAVDKYPNESKFVAGSMGPTTKMLSLNDSIDFDFLSFAYYLQAKGLIKGGVDFLLLETCQDTCNIKAALLGIEKCFKEISLRIPIAISVTIENTGRMLAGQSLEALIASLSHLDLLFLGINCAIGISSMAKPMKIISEKSPFKSSCMPNAGLPDEDGNYLDTPEEMAKFAYDFAKNGWINLIGGCCGTDEKHISAIKKAVENIAPRKPKIINSSQVSHLDVVEISDNKCIYIGERCNVIGSKKFKTLISEEKFEEAVSVGKAQVSKGAKILDICLSNPERNEKSDMLKFLPSLLKAIRVPIMIDSTDADVIEAALKKCQGKAIINSINLEDGKSKFEKIVLKAKTYGASIVVGLIDEKGMAVDVERKLEIATRSHEILVHEYGIKEENIFWDPLTFPCSSGDINYINSATHTINAIKVLKKEFPLTKTILGISNVSFGLPSLGRKALNSVFLHHAIKAGLNLAIVNVEQLVEYYSIPEKETVLSEKLLFSFDASALSEFKEYFGSKKEIVYEKEKVPINEKVKMRLVLGDKSGLFEDLNELLKESTPLEIINGPLLSGMDEVGKLFNDNKLIVAEVLQSAEVMNAAIKYLRNFMPLNAKVFSGKILIATVKGDVHDIGKHLVDIIFSNNGFEVIDFGTKVSSESLIAGIKEQKADIVGLSGLLVRSAHEMISTLSDFSSANITVPVIVGGAALTQKFVSDKIKPKYIGKVYYAKNAMSGLKIAKSILNRENITDSENLVYKKSVNEEKLVSESTFIRSIKELPSPIDFERHIISGSPNSLELWDFINKKSLFFRHLGLRSNTDSKYKKIADEVEFVRYKFAEILFPKAVYQFFKAISENNNINLYENNLKIETLIFPREIKPPYRSIADYVSKDDFDSIALFAVTVGINVLEHANKLKNDGEFLHSHILLSLSIELAEAMAEYVHKKIREYWGFPDTDSISTLELIKGHYRGKRYSFGMSACPQLNEQTKILKLLRAEEIGISLTENFMMVPESSTSGVVVHHPDAKYFSI